jgi:hypothetical protein
MNDFETIIRAISELQDRLLKQDPGETFEVRCVLADAYNYIVRQDKLLRKVDAQAKSNLLSSIDARNRLDLIRGILNLNEEEDEV